MKPGPLPVASAIARRGIVAIAPTESGKTSLAWSVLWAPTTRRRERDADFALRAPGEASEWDVGGSARRPRLSSEHRSAAHSVVSSNASVRTAAHCPDSDRRAHEDGRIILPGCSGCVAETPASAAACFKSAGRDRRGSRHADRFRATPAQAVESSRRVEVTRA